MAASPDYYDVHYNDSHHHLSADHVDAWGKAYFKGPEGELCHDDTITATMHDVTGGHSVPDVLEEQEQKETVSTEDVSTSTSTSSSAPAESFEEEGQVEPEPEVDEWGNVYFMGPTGVMTLKDRHGYWYYQKDGESFTKCSTNDEGQWVYKDSSGKEHVCGEQPKPAARSSTNSTATARTSMTVTSRSSSIVYGLKTIMSLKGISDDGSSTTEADVGYSYYESDGESCCRWTQSVDAHYDYHHDDKGVTLSQDYGRKWCHDERGTWQQ